jgi:outer membrane protein TolC
MSCQGFDDKVGTFAIHLGYEPFDGRRKRSVKREREAQLAQAKERLRRLTDEVELAMHTAYRKLERTQRMLKVSEVVFRGAPDILAANQSISRFCESVEIPRNPP